MTSWSSARFTRHPLKKVTMPHGETAMMKDVITIEGSFGGLLDGDYARHVGFEFEDPADLKPLMN